MTLASKPPVASAAGAGFDWRLALILLFAFALRIGAAQLWPNIQWPDEIYQTLEPAHRMVFGYGYPSWEWQAGIRSPALPAMFAGLFEIAKWFALGPQIYLPCVQAILCGLSLSVVWVSYRLGAATEGGSGGSFGAATAAAPAALWVDLVLMAPHPLFDPIAAHVMILGLYLLQTGGREPGWTRDGVAGAMLGFAVALRPSFGPPLLLGVLSVAGGRGKRWMGLVAGAIPVLLAYGAADLFQGQWPFESTIRYLGFNLAGTGNGTFGVEPWNFYSSLIVLLWGGALPFLILLIFIGARNHSVWLVVAAALIAEHSALPHKEYRFLYPAIACLMPVVGAGAARVSGWAAANWVGPEVRAATIRIAWLVTAGCSAALARQPMYVERWTSGYASLRAFEALREDASVCGVGLLKGVTIAYVPGYVWLHRDIPWMDNIEDPGAVAGRFSDLLSAGPRTDLPMDFVSAGCWRGSGVDHDAPGTICRYHRPGSCTAGE